MNLQLLHLYNCTYSAAEYKGFELAFAGAQTRLKYRAIEDGLDCHWQVIAKQHAY